MGNKSIIEVLKNKKENKNFYIQNNLHIAQRVSVRDLITSSIVDENCLFYGLRIVSYTPYESRYLYARKNLMIT